MADYIIIIIIILFIWSTKAHSVDAFTKSLHKNYTKKFTTGLMAVGLLHIIYKIE